jgi:hypothetical protein
VQPPVAEPPPFTRQFPQPAPQAVVIRPDGPVAEDPWIDPDQPAGAALRVAL